jgi:hypothetical protein
LIALRKNTPPFYYTSYTFSLIIKTDIPFYIKNKNPGTQEDYLLAGGLYILKGNIYFTNHKFFFRGRLIMLIMVFFILLGLFFLFLLMTSFNLKKKVLLFYLPAFLAVLLTISMIIYPKEAFEAAVNGLAIWWNIVFPALLPFFVFSQVLIGLGVVHFLGVLLEPIMRPLFNVPGTGSFVLAMGLASGFPPRGGPHQ